MMMVVTLLMKMDYLAKSLSVNKIGLGITKQEHCLVSMYEQVEMVMMTTRLLRTRQKHSTYMGQFLQNRENGQNVNPS